MSVHCNGSEQRSRAPDNECGGQRARRTYRRHDTERLSGGRTGAEKIDDFKLIKLPY